MQKISVYLNVYIMTIKSVVIPLKIIGQEEKQHLMMTEMIENHNDALRKRNILSKYI